MKCPIVCAIKNWRACYRGDQYRK